MGEVISLPTRPKIVERFEEVQTYAAFGALRVTLARSRDGGPMLALILAGLGPAIGFEVLGRFHDTEADRAACDAMARAVAVTILHLAPT